MPVILVTPNPKILPSKLTAAQQADIVALQ